MPTTDELEARIAKLESQGKIKFFVQYLLSPILILLIGGLLNFTVERGKSESNRIDIAQKMIPPLFAGNSDQAFATERLLARVLDANTAHDLHEIVAKYYQSKIDANLREGNVEAAQKIVSSAESIGGPAAETIVKTVASDKAQTETLQKYASKSELASQKEREGFESLIAGNYDNAINAFQSAEAAYPRYHDVYELARLIKDRKAQLDDPEKRKELFRLIVSQHSFRAPADLLERIKEMSK